MTIYREDIQRLAKKLAKIRLDDDECDDLTQNIQKIITFIEQLSAVDVSGVQPLYSPIFDEQCLRADTITDGDNVAAVLSNAPQSRHGFFVVPKIIAAS